MAKEVFEAFEGQQATLGFSQAVRVDETIYVAGSVGMGEGGRIPDELVDQMRLAYDNVANALAHFGADMRHVVTQTLHVTDITAAVAALDARKQPFPAGALPASTLVEVTALARPQLKVEVTVIARLDG